MNMNFTSHNAMHLGGGYIRYSSPFHTLLHRKNIESLHIWLGCNSLIKLSFNVQHFHVCLPPSMRMRALTKFFFFASGYVYLNTSFTIFSQNHLLCNTLFRCSDLNATFRAAPVQLIWSARDLLNARPSILFTASFVVLPPRIASMFTWNAKTKITVA